MAKERLLRIERLQELPFRFEPGKQNSYTVRLFNISQDHVAFKVLSTNQQKSRARPTTGLLLPTSNCDVTVTIHAQEEASSNIECKGRFLFKCVAVKPDDTADRCRELLEKKGRMVQSCQLRVLNEFPSRQQPSNIESDLNGAHEFPSRQQPSNIESDSNGAERRNRDGTGFSDLLIIGIITVVLLCLILGHLIMKMLPFIWSLGAITVMLVAKMMWKLVSDSVEDWILNALLNLSVHFISVFSRRREEQTRQ